MRASSLFFLALLIAGLSACAPFQTVPGDLCNNPAENYTADYAYECNHH